jgi:hypothetical protein
VLTPVPPFDPRALHRSIAKSDLLLSSVHGAARMK